MRAAAMLGALGLPSVGWAQTITTTLVSKNPSGEPGDGVSADPAITPDGRYILFNSAATDLIATLHDTNFSTDVFVWDRVEGVMTLASLKSDGEQIYGANVGGGFITPDGRYVILGTKGKLTPDDTNFAHDIYVRDLVLGTTTLASKLPSGSVSATADCFAGDVSDNGRFVVFFSEGNEFGNRDTNLDQDVYWRDMQLGTVQRVSVSTHGIQGNGDSTIPRISGDGRFVFFESFASNLVRGDTNNALDIFAHDMLTGRTLRQSLTSTGAQGVNGGSGALSVSTDNRYLAFQSLAKNLDPHDQNVWTDVYVRDNLTGQVALASHTSAGFAGNGLSLNPSISADGRYVAFESVATDLVTPDANGLDWDIYRFDRITGAVIRVSQSSAGVQADSHSLRASISGDGGLITYYSYATNLVPNDPAGERDVFLAEITP